MLGIVGLVLCFAVIPAVLAIVFGVIALREIGRSDGSLRGKGMATAGLVLGIVGLVVAAVFYVAAAAGAFDSDGEAIAGVEVGDCVRVPEQGFSRLREQDCDEPHEGEMFLRGEIEGAGQRDYPGEAIQRDVRDRCLEEFDTYVGMPYATSALEFVFIYPTENNWDDDDGTYACIAYNVDRSDLPPGSVQGSNR